MYWPNSLVCKARPPSLMIAVLDRFAIKKVLQQIKSAHHFGLIRTEDVSPKASSNVLRALRVRLGHEFLSEQRHFSWTTSH